MSFSHMLILGIIAIIVIPPEKLPEVARQIAKFLGDLRRMTSGMFDDLKEQVVLTPEELMKQKQAQNTIQKPDAVVPVVAAKPELTPEEKKKQEDEYAKHIQGEPIVDEKKPT